VRALQLPRSALCLLGALLWAGPALAQYTSGIDLLRQHMARGIAETQVGDWATFRVHGGLAGREHFWRVAVVGEAPDPKGRPAFWYEVEMGQHHKMVAPLLQVRVQVAKDPAAVDRVTRAFVAWGVEKVRELSPASVSELFNGASLPPSTEPRAASPLDRKQVNVRARDEQRLMTFGGTVTAVPVEIRYRSTVLQRYWMSREIPILQLAKIEIPAVEHSIEVRGFGRDAVPRMILPVDGTPTLRLEELPASVLMPTREMMSIATGGGHED
jgi:hypothetical protein